MKATPKHDAWLMKYAYPITFDLFFIPMMTTFSKLGTCPEGLEHIKLPDGSSCQCINRFGYFWVTGTGGFIILYSCALYYKLNIEKLNTTMDFRFQPGFQIIMAMARTSMCNSYISFSLFF